MKWHLERKSVLSKPLLIVTGDVYVPHLKMGRPPDLFSQEEHVIEANVPEVGIAKSR